VGALDGVMTGMLDGGDTFGGGTGVAVGNADAGARTNTGGSAFAVARSGVAPKDETGAGMGVAPRGETEGAGRTLGGWGRMLGGKGGVGLRTGGGGGPCEAGASGTSLGRGWRVGGGGGPPERTVAACGSMENGCVGVTLSAIDASACDAGRGGEKEGRGGA
jgi:hypothetical protein